MQKDLHYCCGSSAYLRLSSSFRASSALFWPRCAALCFNPRTLPPSQSHASALTALHPKSAPSPEAATFAPPSTASRSAAGSATHRPPPRRRRLGCLGAWPTCDTSPRRVRRPPGSRPPTHAIQISPAHPNLARPPTQERALGPASPTQVRALGSRSTADAALQRLGHAPARPPGSHAPMRAPTHPLTHPPTHPPTHLPDKHARSPPRTHAHTHTHTRTRLRAYTHLIHACKYSSARARTHAPPSAAAQKE